MIANLCSFDRTERVDSELVRPDRYRHLFAALTADVPVIARGAGLSYVAASAGAGTRSISSSCFNRILTFDGETGKLVAEPGLRIGDLLTFAAERGWYPPVLPGHPMITLGGCVAMNVHGKSHCHGGSFDGCVHELALFHPDHGEIVCNREVEPELFELTVGGLGLTGFITRVELRLVPLRGGLVERRRLPVASLHEAVAVMRELAPTVDAVYSWNDLNLRGHRFGRGIVYAESFLAGPFESRTVYRTLAADRPRRPPLSPYARPITRSMTAIYQLLERSARRSVRLDLKTAAFPINGKELYYALFGRRGFREYQMIVPFEAWESAAEEIARLIARHKVGVTLGSLKLFASQETQSLLNFSRDGICLALDTPATDAARELFAALDEVTVAHRGLLNLAKDSRVEASMVRRVFAGYDEFHDRLLGFDPRRRFDSALRRRVLNAA